jgi:hypothetical protein
LSSENLKLSDDGFIMMVKIRNIDGNPTSQIIDLASGKVLVEAEGPSQIDLSVEGTSVLIWQRGSGFGYSLKVDVNENKYTLPGEEDLYYRLILVDLKTGNYSQMPYTSFLRSIPDLEFSSNEKIAYLQRGLSILSLDVSSWELSDISVKNRPTGFAYIKLLRQPEGADLLVYPDGDFRRIINAETGEFFGGINDRYATLVVSPTTRNVLSLYNGVYKRHEFREGKFIPATFIPEDRYTDTWNLRFNSREGSFYKIQSSWDLQKWEFFENTPMGTGKPHEEYFMRLYPPTKIFGRVIEFSAPELAD